ncbi:MAG: MmcQ/YjbR family DNA-binding protein [Bacteroides sp]|nr:MmcQ/YjbR family DNA-binding protein [Bacteroides sp.]
MNIEEVREYCLSLPQVTEDFPFDETTLVFRIEQKIFAMVDLEDTQWFVLKCEPEYALELRERHPEISGAWHMNKKYWNQLNLFGQLRDELVKYLIRHSYNEVVKKLPRKVKEEKNIGLLSMENKNTNQHC